MRALLIVALVAGCVDGPGTSDAEGASDGGSADRALAADLNRCPAGSCACGPGEACHPASIYEQFVRTCLKKCSATTECPPGLICAEMFGSAFPPFGGLCVSRSVPVACFDDDGWHCSLQSGCRDAKTLLVPFSWATNRVCGLERVPCPNGCDEGGPDAGWAPARCRP